MERLPNEDGLELRSAPGLSRPVERNPRIDGYLDTVFAPLIDIVPPARLRELRAELAAHVEALVEAHRELGSDADEALRAALKQIGDARRLSSLWGREWRRPAGALARRGMASMSSMLLAGLALSASAWFSGWLLVALEQHLGHNLFELTLGGPLLPLAAGLGVGLERGRHPLGSRCGLLLIALAGLGVSLAMGDADPRPPVVTLIRVLMWAWTSCSAAGLGALIASGREFLRPRAARS